jgi:hypothetical protein
MKMTESERLFEHFCITHKLSFERVPETNLPSADYLLFFNNYKIVAEIKQLEPNKEEKEIIEKPAEEWDQYDVYHWEIPGERIRKKIKSAMPQLQALSQGILPTVIILFDNIKVWPELIDEYAVRVAMYGIETAIISPEVAPEGGAKILQKWYGQRKQATSNQNTTLSAIAVMKETENGVMMRIYHNYYAKNLIEKKIFCFSGVEQFELGGAPSEGFPKWSKIILSNN